MSVLLGVVIEMEMSLDLLMGSLSVSGFVLVQPIKNNLLTLWDQNIGKQSSLILMFSVRVYCTSAH